MQLIVISLLALIALPVLLIIYAYLLTRWFTKYGESPWIKNLFFRLEHHSRLILGGMTGLFIIVFWAFVYNSFDKVLFGFPEDYNLFYQAMQHLAEFKWFHYFSTDPCNFLLVHFFLYLFLQLPFYLLWPHVMNQAFQQVVLVALGIPAMYLLTRQQTKDKVLALIFAGIYASSFAIHQYAILDVYEENLSVPLLLFAFYFLEKRSRLGYLIFLGLILSLREDMCFVIFGFAAMTFLQKRDKFFFYAPVILGLAYLMVYMGFLFIGHNKGFSIGILDFMQSKINFIIHPAPNQKLSWWAVIMEPALLPTLMQIRLLLPLFFLIPLLAPAYIIPAVPIVLRNLFLIGGVRACLAKYGAVVIACIFAGLAPACIKWAERFPLPARIKAMPKKSRMFWVVLFLLLANMNTHYLIGCSGDDIEGKVPRLLPQSFINLPLLMNYVVHFPRITAPSLGKELQELRLRIPRDAQVITTVPGLLVCLGDRETHLVLIPSQQVDVKRGKTFWILPQEYFQYEYLLLNNDYRRIFATDHFRLFFQ